MTLFSFSIYFFCPNSSFSFYFNSFYLFNIYSIIFLLFTSERSSSFLYISLSLFNFSIKLLSLKELFISVFSSSSRVLSPLWMVLLSFYSSSFSNSMALIYSLRFLMIYLRLSCLTYYLFNTAWTSANYFSLTSLSSVKLELISLIY